MLLRILLCGSMLILWGSSAEAITLATNGKPQAVIVTAAGAIPAEQTAASELAGYLQKITGAEFTIVGENETPETGTCVFVGPTGYARRHGLDPEGWGPERWAMRTIEGNLVLVGGRPRGTIYATYRFLEDELGVRWWNPFEEHVPNRATFEIGPLDRQGCPTFRYRDIHRVYAYDNGRFAARNRLNGKGFGAIDTAYGSGVYFGPPGGVHTFYQYIRPETYFEEHPEWFSLIGGKRTAKHAQLCLTNQELRGVIIEKLKGFVASSRQAAEAAGQPAPQVFDISQNDWYGPCQCAKCQALVEQQGAESGPLLDFLNQVADAVKADYPDIRIITLAYQYTEDPPKSIRPRDNVIPRLCDTNANLLRPITHDDNRPFAERVAAWGRITKELWIWDYAVTYRSYRGLPLPTVHTYPTDYRYLAEHNVTGIFTEHEYELLADMRDLKIWMMIKLLEDPYRDYEALLVDFTDGFYGPAGKHVRQFLAELEAAADKHQSNVDWFPELPQYDYLTLDFVRRAQTVFDDAQSAVASRPVLARRLRHARLPIDRAALVLWPKLMRRWIASGGQPKEIPLDRSAIADRCRQTWNEQIDLRIPEARRAAERAKCEAEIAPLMARPEHVELPAKFRDLPAARVLDFTAERATNFRDQAKKVPDPEAECGVTNRLVVSDEQMKKYKLPMPWGLYDPDAKRVLGSAQIKANDVPGSGYHWYKLGTFDVPESGYVYFYWSWITQFGVGSATDGEQAESKFDIWARIKFEGPGFPHGKSDEPNAICIERVVLVRQR